MRYLIHPYSVANRGSWYRWRQYPFWTRTVASRCALSLGALPQTPLALSSLGSAALAVSAWPVAIVCRHRSSVPES